MEELEIAREKVKKLEKEIEEILNPYFTSDQKYEFKINQYFSRFEVYVEIKHYIHCGTTINFKKYVYYNNVFTPVNETDLQEYLDILSSKEFIMQEVERIRQQEEELQEKKKKLLGGD